MTLATQCPMAYLSTHGTNKWMTHLILSEGYKLIKYISVDKHTNTHIYIALLMQTKYSINHPQC